MFQNSVSGPIIEFIVLLYPESAKNTGGGLKQGDNEVFQVLMQNRQKSHRHKPTQTDIRCLGSDVCLC